MPTLPEVEEPPSPGERLGSVIRRATAAVGADARVTLRVLVALAVLGIAGSTGPMPWPQVAAIALVYMRFVYRRVSL